MKNILGGNIGYLSPMAMETAVIINITAAQVRKTFGNAM